MKELKSQQTPKLIDDHEIPTWFDQAFWKCHIVRVSSREVYLHADVSPLKTGRKKSGRSSQHGQLALEIGGTM